MKRQLIVNADDFARHPEVDRGILTSHKKGIVTTTTVLINMPAAVEAVQRSQESAPNLAFGLHLNLTLGPPCARESDLHNMVDHTGQFHRIAHWCEALDSVPIHNIEVEWRAQVERFLSTGVPLDHLDSHHHIAIFREDIWELYLTLARELDCGVRPPFPDDTSRAQFETIPSSVLAYAESNALASLKQSHVPSPKAFYASFFDRHATLDHLCEILQGLPAGLSEMMCHPGYAHSAVEASSSYNQQRQAELELLTNPSVLQRIADLQIDLITYRQAWPAT